MCGTSGLAVLEVALELPGRFAAARGFTGFIDMNFRLWAPDDE